VPGCGGNGGEGGVAVGDDPASCLSVLDEVDDAPVGEDLHDEVGDLPQRDLQPEWLVEEVPDAAQQPEPSQGRAEGAVGLERGADGARALGLELVTVVGEQGDTDELGGGGVHMPDNPGGAPDPAGGAVRQEAPVPAGVVAFSTSQGPLHCGAVLGTVLGMDSARDRLEGALEGAGLHAVEILHRGVQLEQARAQVPAPGPRSAGTQGDLVPLPRRDGRRQRTGPAASPAARPILGVVPPSLAPTRLSTSAPHLFSTVTGPWSDRQSRTGLGIPNSPVMVRRCRQKW